MSSSSTVGKFLSSEEIKAGKFSKTRACRFCESRVRIGVGEIAAEEGCEKWRSSLEDAFCVCPNCVGKVLVSLDGDKPSELWLIHLEGYEDEDSSWVSEDELLSARRKADKIFDETGQEIVVCIDEQVKRTAKFY